MTLESHDTQTQRMPAALVTAAVLIGLFGGLYGLAFLLLGALRLDAGGGPMMMLGAVVTGAVMMTIVGLVNGSRAAQIVALLLGVVFLIGSLWALNQGTLAGLLGFPIGVAIMLLVMAPISARDWFAH